MESMFALLDVIVFGCGFYILYLWYMMKFKGEIKTGFLISKDVDIKKCKDKEGYINYIAPRSLAFGVFTILYGGICLANDYLANLGNLVFIGMAVFFVALVWFALCTRKSMKIYW